MGTDPSPPPEPRDTLLVYPGRQLFGEFETKLLRHIEFSPRFEHHADLDALRSYITKLRSESTDRPLFVHWDERRYRFNRRQHV